MARRQTFRRKALQCVLVLVPLILFVTFILQKYNRSFQADWSGALSADLVLSGLSSKTSQQPNGPCPSKRDCPEDHFSFFIRSGAANVVAPKICLHEDLILGTALNNAGYGINIVILNGKTGGVTKTDHFNMYSGDVTPLIDILKGIEHGSIVLMATYDEPSSNLSEEARNLIAELGSSAVRSLGFRDNWVFVGGKGATVKSNFEKHLKNDNEKNAYENWPELIEMQGCIPKYME